MRVCLLLLVLAACEDGERIIAHQGLEPVAPDNIQEEPVAVVETEPATITIQEEPVTVYYQHPLLMALVPRERSVFVSKDLAGRVKQVIDQLSIGPEDDYGLPIWPPNTYVREVYLHGETIVVDFDKGFLSEVNAGAGLENLMVKSLVNSLLDSTEGFNRVYVLIDGEIRESLLGHIDIARPLSKTRVDTVIPDSEIEDQLEEEDLLLEEPTPDLEEGFE